MKINRILLIVFLAGCHNSQQNNHKGMKAFAHDSAFKAAHHTLTYSLPDTFYGKMIAFKTPNGKQAHAYLSPAQNENPTNYLIMFHEWWGLNNYIRHEADYYARALGNVNVLAPDLYNGKVTSSSDTAGELLQNVSDGHIRNVIQGIMQYIGPKARYATIGWCVGGGWSLQCGIIHPQGNIGIVMYYGMPEKDNDKLKKISAPVIGFFGTQDKWITPQLVNDFAIRMKNLHKDFTYKEYDAVHAFANPSNAHYNKAATADAIEITLRFLRKRFE